MKALILAIDALTPEYLYNKKYNFPNIRKLQETGASGTFSAFVQKGYNGSYTSNQNWASIYTGLTPREHKIDCKKEGKKTILPKMSEYNGMQPFWQLLNENDFTVGLWYPNSCEEPVDINGYTISCKYEPIFTPQENREAPRTITVCDKDKDLLKYIDGNPPPRVYPKTLKQYGYSFDEVKQNPDLANNFLNEENFQPITDNFEDEMSFWFNSMKNVQKHKPVDVLYLFTPTLDILTHFVLYSDDNPILINAYKILDKYVGMFLEEFKPETVILMSDHGQQNFKYLVNSKDINLQKEAFSARDKVLWMKNGYIAFEALNGGLLFTAHSLKGVFIASGKGIKQTEISEMRTVDIYPTLLEIFDIKVPEDRSGFVIDIFEKTVINAGKLLKPEEIKYKNIALIQTHEVSVTDIILNELYLENRFSNISVIGESKYEEIFKNNPRVTDFITIENYNQGDFDEVYCGLYNETTGLTRHIKII